MPPAFGTQARNRFRLTGSKWSSPQLDPVAAVFGVVGAGVNRGGVGERAVAPGEEKIWEMVVGSCGTVRKTVLSSAPAALGVCLLRLSMAPHCRSTPAPAGVDTGF